MKFLKSASLYFFVLVTLLTNIKCSKSPENIAELTAPIVYSLVKNALAQEKYTGQLNINVKYENLKNELSGWPSGQVSFDIVVEKYPNKHILIDYILDGTYNATAIVQIPGKPKKQMKINIYENAIILGQVATVEKIIREISTKLSKNIKPNQKVAIFDFVSLSNDKLPFGKRISESLIIHMNEKKISIVERKLLEQLNTEIKAKVAGQNTDDTRKIIGKLLGANLIVVGTIKEEKEELLINARIIDIETGVIINSAQGVVPKYLISQDDLLTSK